MRKAAVASGVFLLLEAAIGAGLVLFEYVAYNPSFARAYWMVAHLVNTFLLLASLTLTAWWAAGHPTPRRQGSLTALLAAALGGVLLLGASGAVAALGDTLSLGGGLDPAADPVVGALVGLRLYHPTLALLVGGAVAAALVAVVRRAGAAWPVRFAGAVGGLYLVQMIVGLINVQLLAPVWMQMVHLLLADALWIALVLFSASALAVPRPSPRIESRAPASA